MRWKPNKPFASGFRDVSYVSRWTILRRNRHQYLAEHSYFVAVYADQIARLIEWDGDYGKLMRYALYHDLDETITGDIPGPAKRLGWTKRKAATVLGSIVSDKFGKDVSDVIASTSKAITSIVSAADSVEEVCYLAEEALSGNSAWTREVMIEAIGRLKHKWYDLPADASLLDKIYREHVETLVNGAKPSQFLVPVLLKDK